MHLLDDICFALMPTLTELIFCWQMIFAHYGRGS